VTGRVHPASPHFVPVSPQFIATRFRPGEAASRVRSIAARNEPEHTMISRLTALAALFAVVTTASLAVAATVHQQHRAVAAATPVVQLERVEVTGHRIR